jgi:hypothetical protein
MRRASCILNFMRYTAKLTRSPSGYCAQCIEIEATGEGGTPQAAVESLRAELHDRLDHVEGVAPPSQPIPTVLEIVVLEAFETTEAAPSGPGDSA